MHTANGGTCTPQSAGSIQDRSSVICLVLITAVFFHLKCYMPFFLGQQHRTQFSTSIMICATVRCPLSSIVQSVSHPQLGCALLYLPWLHCSYVVIHGIKYNKVFPSITDKKHQVRAGTGIQGQDISWIRESYNLLSVGWQEHDYESVCSQLKNTLQCQVCCYVEACQYLMLWSLIFDPLPLISYLFSPSQKTQLALFLNYEDKRQRLTF